MKGALGPQLRRNIASGVGTTLANVALLLISYPLYLHYLGYQTYGLWIILTTVLTLAQMGNLGLFQALTKRVAEEHARGAWRAIESYAASAFLVLGASGAAILAGVWLLRGAIARLFGVGGGEAEVLVALLPWIAALSAYVLLVQALGGILSGLNRMDLTNYAELARRAVALALSAALLALGHGLASLLIGLFASYAMAHGILWWLLRRTARRRWCSWRAADPAKMRRLLSFGLPLFAGRWLDLFLHPLNKLIIVRYADVSMLPVYEMSVAAGLYLQNLAATGLRACMPEVSQRSVHNSGAMPPQVRVLNRSLLRYTIGYSAPLYLMLFWAAPPLLHLWLGSRYVDALPFMLRGMLVASFIGLLGLPSYFVLMGLGRVRECFWAHGLQGAGNVIVIVSCLLALDRIAPPQIVASVIFAFSCSSVYLTWCALRRGT